MDTAIEFLQPIATKEALTALGLLTAIFLGYKVAQRSCGVVGSFASKASYGGLAAAVLGLAGAGTMGVGIGEISSRWNAPDEIMAKVVTPGVQNDELQELVTTFNGHSNPEALDKVIDYVSRRDGLSAKLNDDMLEKLLEKTNADNAAVVQAIIELYKSREERQVESGSPLTLEANTAAVPLNGPMVFTSYKEGSEEPFQQASLGEEAEVTNKDSIVNLPTAYGMLLAGIASCIGSVITMRKKKTEPVATA